MYQHRSVNGNEKILKMDTASSDKQSFTVGVGAFGYHFASDHRDLLTHVASIAAWLVCVSRAKEADESIEV